MLFLSPFHFEWNEVMFDKIYAKILIFMLCKELLKIFF
jgi:hypothetical protein